MSFTSRNRLNKTDKQNVLSFFVVGNWYNFGA